MVRAVTYSLLAFSLLCSCNSPVRDIERYQLHGNVQSIEVYEACDTTSLKDAPATWQSAYFDTKGMLDSLIKKSPYDTLRHIYVYDENDLLKEIQVLHTNNKYEALYEYEYDGNVVSTYKVRGVDMQVIYRWDYDIKDGKAIRSRGYNEGVLINKSDFTYNGLDKTETLYSSDGELLSEMTYRFLDRFRISSIEGDDFELKIEYDEDGLPIKSINAVIGPDGEIYSTNYSHVYGTILYEYTMDERGNWIERRELLGETKVNGNTIKRKIIYR